jgi:hypothetical protein
MSRVITLRCALVVGILLVAASAIVGRTDDAAKDANPVATLQPPADVPRPLSPDWHSPAEKKIIEALKSPT